MREAARWSALVVGVAAAAVSLWAVPHGVAAGEVWSGQPTSTIDGSTNDTTPEPGTTEPESTTATTEPDDTAADTTIGDALVGAGDPDSDIDTTTAAIAVVGFIALIGLASWWMVRRSDPDAAPMPPQPPSDLI
jgi:hypothetical protein